MSGRQPRRQAGSSSEWMQEEPESVKARYKQPQPLILSQILSAIVLPFMLSQGAFCPQRTNLNDNKRKCGKFTLKKAILDGCFSASLSPVQCLVSQFLASKRCAIKAVILFAHVLGSPTSLTYTFC